VSRYRLIVTPLERKSECNPYLLLGAVQAAVLEMWCDAVPYCLIDVVWAIIFGHLSLPVTL